MNNNGYVVISGCKQCGKCFHICNKGALSNNTNNMPKIDYQICNNCMECVKFCPNKAILMIE